MCEKKRVGLKVKLSLKLFALHENGKGCKMFLKCFSMNYYKDQFSGRVAIFVETGRQKDRSILIDTPQTS